MQAMRHLLGAVLISTALWLGQFKPATAETDITVDGSLPSVVCPCVICLDLRLDTYTSPFACLPCVHVQATNVASHSFSTQLSVTECSSTQDLCVAIQSHVNSSRAPALYHHASSWPCMHYEQCDINGGRTVMRRTGSQRTAFVPNSIYQGSYDYLDCDNEFYDQPSYSLEAPATPFDIRCGGNEYPVWQSYHVVCLQQ